jgi:transketolase
VAAGIATGLRLDKKDNYVYLICGDGELNEGQCWEAFQYLAHFKLNNCIVIIDDNKKQLDGLTVDIMNPFDFQKKMEAFGFYTLKIKGDDIRGIDAAIEELKSVKDQAVCLVLDSIKGQGVPYFETLNDNHSVKFNNDEINQAAEETIVALEKSIKEREQVNV